MAKKSEDRDVKRFLGMPMRWDARRMFDNYWNRNEDRILLPRNFGIGWDINFHALVKRVRSLGRRRDRGKAGSDVNG